MTSARPDLVGPAPLGDAERWRNEVDRRLTGFVGEQRERLSELGPQLMPLLDAAVDAVTGGKRLRAAFCYWGWRAAGAADDARVVSAAAALELLHASALVHDDVMDASDTRRGRPAAHRRFARLPTAGGWVGRSERFGTGAAILLGDLLLSWGDELLHRSGFPPERVTAAAPYFDAMRTEVVAGQFLDLVAQSSGRSSVPEAMRVLRFKAAKYTVERPLHLGAALAGADDALIAALSSYGVPLGEAFQLRDDVLGVFGDPDVTGKPAGDDLREGKRTVLIALADERADERQRRRIGRLLGRPDLDDAGVEELRAVITATGALSAVETLIRELTEAAKTSLQHAPIPDPAVHQALLGLATAATRRSW
ncbi:MAG: polyprenyl synthetase family protein [Actinomycetota bacterium]|nr:polyprenyl synthetase family protein [Actinomycetota bacterium]